MKNKQLFSLLFVMVMVFNVFLSTNGFVLGASMEGNGTESSPYLIRTVEDLYSIPNNPTAHYKLMNDLDLENVERAPMAQFNGMLDGSSYKITNVYINGVTDVGIFSSIKKGTIKNLNFDKVKINATGSNNGVLCGYGYNMNLENCIIDNAIVISTGGGNVGALGGHALTTSSIKNCHVLNANIEASGFAIGGLIGHSSDSEMIQSSFQGYISSKNNEIGGLVGAGKKLELSECFSFSNINGIDYIGGIIGYCSPYDENYLNINNSYFKGTIEGNKYVGGLVGNAGYITVNNSYVSGIIGGSSEVDGICSKSLKSEINNSYFNTELIDIREPIAQARTTEQMYKKSNYKNWDFESVWLINEEKEYPRLQFELDVYKPVGVPVNNLSIYPAQAEITMGESLWISPFITPENATNQNVIWISTNPDSFTVDENGIVFPVSLGHGAVICVTEDGRHIAYCNIVIKEEEILEVPSQNLALQSTITTNNTQKDVIYINDDDLTTKWVAKNGVTGNVTIRLDLEQSAEVNQVVVSESSHVTNYILQYLDNGSWKDIQAGTTLGIKSEINFLNKEITSLRLVIKGYSAPPEVFEIQVYKK